MALRSHMKLSKTELSLYAWLAFFGIVGAIYGDWVLFAIFVLLIIAGMVFFRLVRCIKRAGDYEPPQRSIPVMQNFRQETSEANRPIPQPQRLDPSALGNSPYMQTNHNRPAHNLPQDPQPVNASDFPTPSDRWDHFSTGDSGNMFGLSVRDGSTPITHNFSGNTEHDLPPAYNAVVDTTGRPPAPPSTEPTQDYHGSNSTAVHSYSLFPESPPPYMQHPNPQIEASHNEDHPVPAPGYGWNPIASPSAPEYSHNSATSLQPPSYNQGPVDHSPVSGYSPSPTVTTTANPVSNDTQNTVFQPSLDGLPSYEAAIVTRTPPDSSVFTISSDSGTQL